MYETPNMDTKVLITGGTGLVGMYLSELLAEKGYSIVHLSRTEKLNKKFPAYKWDIDAGYIDPRALQVDHVVHLAGESVAGGRWTAARKKSIYDSRIKSTRLLVEKIKSDGPQVKTFVSASAVGYYGWDTGAVWVDEEAKSGSDFLAKVVIDWESETNKLEQIAVSTIRIGIVLSDKDGALPKLALPIKLGAGAALGNGQQYMSWIHIHDLASMFCFAIEHKLLGAYNAVAPQPATNREFTKQTASVLKKPLFLPPVPGFVMKAMMGEMSQIVLGGNRVSSKKVVEAGFVFTYDELKPALQNLLS
ncbi:MAG: hypothetical protein ACI8QD_001202 [Cyclobacteriaceae bacterium]|jgi:uncharacterized protein (TIGR01777 family)